MEAVVDEDGHLEHHQQVAAGETDDENVGRCAQCFTSATHTTHASLKLTASFRNLE